MTARTFCCDTLKSQFSTDPTPGADDRFIVQEEGEWGVIGCCGTCLVLEKMKFCPFCGTKLPETQQ